VVYKKMANKDEAPIRLLQGNRTRLADPHGITIDTKQGVMFVSNYGGFHETKAGMQEAGSRGRKSNWPVRDHMPGSGKFFPSSISVYPLKATGDTPPLRVIQGTKTQLNWPAAMSIDPERGDLYVANDAGDSLLVFRATASGDAAPARVVKGPRTGIKNPTGVFVDLKNQEVWLSNMGNHRATVYPLSASGNRFCVYGAAQEGVPLQEILRRQMDPMVFPVPLEALAAKIEVHDIVEGAVPLRDFRVRAFRLRHPGTTLGFRLEPAGGGREIAYLTDNELGPGGTYPVSEDWRERLVQFLAGTDTLIHDAMYADQFIRLRAGWGHSTPRQAVDLAAEAGCARLFLFHHEPEHDDDAIDRLVVEAREHARRVAPKLVVDAAVEGGGFTL